MTIRALHEGDLDAVMKVETASFVEPWSRSLFAEEIAQPTRRYVTATDEGSWVRSTSALSWQGRSSGGSSRSD